jgi:SEC-C motif domain protein
VIESALCPCGSGNAYSFCCEPFHSGGKLPLTAEALMRSRFSAYKLDLTDYIQLTWENSTRPKKNKLNFGGEKIDWLKLEIVDVKKGEASDSKGIVEFKAYFQKDGEEQTLHEISRFVKNNGRWVYLDGVVKPSGAQIQQLNEGKNAPCPCGSGKKFKRCCGAAK